MDSSVLSKLLGLLGAGGERPPINSVGPRDGTLDADSNIRNTLLFADILKNVNRSGLGASGRVSDETGILSDGSGFLYSDDLGAQVGINDFGNRSMGAYKDIPLGPTNIEFGKDDGGVFVLVTDSGPMGRKDMDVTRKVYIDTSGPLGKVYPSVKR